MGAGGGDRLLFWANKQVEAWSTVHKAVLEREVPGRHRIQRDPEKSSFLVVVWPTNYLKTPGRELAPPINYS